MENLDIIAEPIEESTVTPTPTISPISSTTGSCCDNEDSDSGNSGNSGGTSIHNALQGIQGGSTSERYHLTKAQWLALGGSISGYVSLTTDQEIEGEKTFTQSPVIPDAVDADQAASYGQLLDLAIVISDLFPPTYITPIEILTTTQSTTGLEYGQVVNIPLTSVFTKNDAGNSVGLNIRKNGTSISTSSPYTDNSVQIGLTDIIYDSVRTYGDGLVKNDIFGHPYGTGRIVAGSITSNSIIYKGSYYLPYGAAASAPTNSAEARALAQNRLSGSGNVFNLNSGTTFTKQYVILPPDKTLVSVIDLDASNQNITGQYILINNNFTVNNAAAVAVTGNKLYERVQGSPYLSNHRHQITIS